VQGRYAHTQFLFTSSVFFCLSYHQGVSLHHVRIYDFYPDGHYIHWSPDTSAPEDFSGVEYGNYSYNSASGELTVTVAMDLNGDAGLSEVTGTATLFGISVDADTITNGETEFARVK
jgi:hypothetical protein